MHLQTTIFSLLLALANSSDSKHEFGIDFGRDTFVLDGKPFRYISGSVHYFRLHPSQWLDRLRKVRAAGFNAVQIYVDWSLHEPEPDRYLFTDDADVERFVSLAAESNLFVILRTGPYMDAERDFGGLPPWLLTQKGIKLRSSDPRFLDRVDKWYAELLPRLKKFLVQSGGPILMVQVENEYGSYGTVMGNCETKYLAHLRDLIRQHLGNNTFLFSVDGYQYSQLRCSLVADVYQTVDFGPGKIYTEAFKHMRQINPRGPLVNTEYYPGWYDVWGQPHHRVNSSIVAEDLDAMLGMGANVNMYPVAGGTLFGFKAGGEKSDSVPYHPVATSYDFDAPISEAGDLTEKYQALKNVIAKYDHVPDIPVANSTKASYGEIKMEPLLTLVESLPYLAAKTVRNEVPLSFEDMSHYYGIALYMTVVKEHLMNPVKLHVKGGVRDRAHIFVNGEFQGYLSRTEGVDTTAIYAEKGHSLILVVENQGRVAFGKYLIDPKGIVEGEVSLNGRTARDWVMAAIPLDDETKMRTFAQAVDTSRSSSRCTTPSKFERMSFWRGTFKIPEENPADTFLSFPGWSKGVAIVNGFNLGRYWPDAGPQKTLYLPGPVLHGNNATNTVVILEQDMAKCLPKNGDFSDCKVTSQNYPEL